jgi:hypothetical protein
MRAMKVYEGQSRELARRTFQICEGISALLATSAGDRNVLTPNSAAASRSRASNVKAV